METSFFFYMCAIMLLLFQLVASTIAFPEVWDVTVES